VYEKCGRLFRLIDGSVQPHQTLPATMHANLFDPLAKVIVVRRVEVSGLEHIAKLEGHSAACQTRQTSVRESAEVIEKSRKSR